MYVLQMAAKVCHLAGDDATEGTRGKTLVNLAVERERHVVTVPPAADSAAERTWGRERIRAVAERRLRGQRQRPTGKGAKNRRLLFRKRVRSLGLAGDVRLG